MKPEELIGRKVRGFKFKESDNIFFTEEMAEYIGKDGIIEAITADGNLRVRFEDNYRYYPYPEILNHLVDIPNEELLQAEKVKLKDIEHQLTVAKAEISRLEELIKYENEPKVEDIVKVWNHNGGGFIMKSEDCNYKTSNPCDSNTRQCWTATDVDDNKEAVNHPSHYGGEDNPYEVIKVIRAWDLGFELGNTAKYIARAGKKDPNKEIEDLEKGIKYLQMRVDYLRSKNKHDN